MPHQQKIPPDEKLKIVQSILAGSISGKKAAAGAGVSQTTVRGWLRIYAAEGAAGFAPRTTNTRTTPETKAAAVEEYLRGGASLFDICQKYKIRNTQNLQKWVEHYQKGEELRFYAGGSRQHDEAYYTAAERLAIVRECIDNGCNYGETALKYKLSYAGLLKWVQLYQSGAPEKIKGTKHATCGRLAKGLYKKTPRIKRLLIVLDCIENKNDYGGMAAKYGVSYQQVNTWVLRYKRDGWAGLNDKKCAPPPLAPEQLALLQKIDACKTDTEVRDFLYATGTPDEQLIALLLRAGYGWPVIAKIHCDLL